VRAYSVKKILNLLGRAIKRFIDNDGFVYSASISFNVMLATIPFLFFLLSLAAIFMPELVRDQAELRDIVGGFFPYSADLIVKNIHLLYERRGALGLIGMLALFLTTFSFTNAVHVSLAAMQNDGRGRNFFRVFITHAVGILITAVFLLIVVSAGSLLALISRMFLTVKTPVVKVLLGETVLILKIGVPFSVISIASILAYRHPSAVDIPLKYASAGGVVFALSVYVLKGFITLYVRKLSKLNIIYGSIFGVVCFIIASYLFASVFLYVACVIGESLEEKNKSEKRIPL
jgi:membrane protein